MAPKRKRTTSGCTEGGAAVATKRNPPSPRQDNEEEKAAAASEEIIAGAPQVNLSTGNSTGRGTDKENTNWNAFVNTHQDEIQEVLLDAMVGFWDTATLVRMKAVNRQWNRMCALAIQAKLVGKPKPFQSNAELRSTVYKYCGGNGEPPDPVDTERIAQTYGYPIGKWDVSQVVDMNSIFCRRMTFNEDISDWDTSNVTNLSYMFLDAQSFDRPIGNWNTSKVRNMHLMFRDAKRFDQDITNWDTGTVADMYCMFLNATSFNQNIAQRWNLQSLQDSTLMFYGATSFAHQEAWDAAVAAAKAHKAEN